jgi:undecaprenyl-diphosphatase
VSKSVFFLALATFPLVFMALFLEYARLLDLSRQVEIIAFSNLIFALLLFVSDRKPSQRKFSNITAKDVLVIGIWQSFAAFPGTSRSGASITGARFFNYGRKEAIIISAVLSIPAIVISSGYIGFKFFSNPDKIDIEFIIYATVFSFIFSYLALKLFVRFGELFSFTPYVIYRLLLGLALLTALYF